MELGANVAVAPVGRPVAVMATLQPPPVPVKDTFTDDDAPAPYCAVLPAVTGLGACDPSTCTLVNRSMVVKEMSAFVNWLVAHFVRTRANSCRLGGMFGTVNEVVLPVSSPVSLMSDPPGVVPTSRMYFSPPTCVQPKFQDVLTLTPLLAGVMNCA